MSCYYIIKSPNGGKDIIIPATFGKIESSKNIEELMKQLKSFGGRELTEDEKIEKEKVISDLTLALRRITPEQIHTNTIKSSIIRNSENPDNIISEINDKIFHLGNYDNITSALINYIKDKTNKGNLKELLTNLQAPITPKYFIGLSMEGVIGSTNLSYEQAKLHARKQENLEFGFSNLIPDNLNTFINGVLNGNNKQYKQLAKTNAFLTTSNTFGGRALNLDGFTLFNDNDDLSLFLGLFKRVASDVDKEELYKILEEFNKDIKFKKYGKIDLEPLETFDVFKFFNGEITDKDKILPSLFDQMLDLSKADITRPHITNILKLVSNHLKIDNSDLFKSIQTLFWTLSPEKYGSEVVRNELLQQEFINKEIKTELSYKNRIKADFLEKVSKDRYLFYAENEIISENLFDEAIKNITLNQDIIKFGTDITSPFGVVTGIFPRSEGVMIHGVHKRDGKVIALKHLFKEGTDKITYRKREDSKDPYIPNEIIVPNEDGLVISIKDKFPQDVLKRLINKGDRINKDYLVIGVNAGTVTIRLKNGEESFTKYSDIKVLISSQAQTEIDLAKGAGKNPNKYVPITDGDLLSDGDLFIDPGTNFYKQILFSDDKNVYSWIQQKDKDTIIKATPRNKIKDGLSYVYGKITAEEKKKIDKEIPLIGKSNASMSSFTDNNTAKKGDYFITTIDGKEVFGKVIDDKVKKGIIFDPIVTIPKPIMYSSLSMQFFTNRDISSNFSLTVSRVNDWEIFPLDPTTAEENLKFKKVHYVVPKGTNKNELILLPSKYANVGKYRTDNIAIAEDEEDATEDILRLLKESGIDVEGASLYVQSESSTGKGDYFKRDLYSLHRINNFNNLTENVKKELDILHPGTYFSVYNQATMDSNIYRIMEVRNGIVTAHLNKISKLGKILTFEKRFKVEELLASKSQGDALGPVNSIAALYLQHGNNKFQLVINAINNNMSLEDVANQKAIDRVLQKMKVTFSKINVSVKRVSAKTGNFKNGQHAKIETNEDGKTTILINKDSSVLSDLVHETLHIYLTALRYQDLDVYNKFLSSVLIDPKYDYMNITEREEEFVKVISEKVNSDTDFLVENLEDFTKILELSIKLVNPDFSAELAEGYFESVENDPFTLLNTPLSTVFGVNTIDNSHQMFNLSMITTEPAMREWMASRQIILKC